MFIYCICPFGKLKSNFIKIGLCTNPDSLKKRYSTYYGASYKCYYIKANESSFEKKIHKKLKKQGLHIENELFVYNENYNFNFYIQQLNEIYNEEENIIKKLDILNLKKESVKNVDLNFLFPCKNECCIDEVYINDEFCKSCEKGLKHCISCNIRFWNDELDIKKCEDCEPIEYYDNINKSYKSNIIEFINIIDKIEDIILCLKELKESYINFPGLEILDKLILFNNIIKSIYIFYN